MLKTFISLFVLLFGIALCAYYPNFVEHFYSEGIFIYISGFLRCLLNPVSFSIGDIFYAVMILAFLVSLYLIGSNLVKKRYKAVYVLLLKQIITLQAAIVIFYTFWGLNYFRQPGYRVLRLTDNAYTLSDVKTVTASLIDSLNNTRKQCSANDLIQDNQTIFNKATSAITQLKAGLNYRNNPITSVKPSVYSGLLNYMGTAGYNNPFTGEAQLNTLMPVFDRPATACHEMAHQLGFAREDEANFIGFLAAKQSDDVLLKYSGYYLATQEFLQYLYRRNSASYKYFKSKLTMPVTADFKTDSAYWQKYEGQIELLTGRFYNAFLKANNQPAGLHTYNRMIILTMAYYRKRQHRAQLN